MKIGVDIRTLATDKLSGIGFYTLHLLRNFLNDKSVDWVLLSSGSNTAHEKINKNLELIKDEMTRGSCAHRHARIPNRALNASVFFWNKPTLHSQEKCDVVFYPNINFIPFDTTPSVVSAHDLSFLIYPKFFTKKMLLWHKMVRPAKIFQNAKAIVAPSESTKNDLALFYKIQPEKITVIPHGVEFDMLNLKQATSDESVATKYGLKKNYILFIGTLEPRKNIETLISAFEMTDGKNDLVIAGGAGWKYQNILKRVAQSKYKEKIKWIDYFNESDKGALLRNASMFVYPSFYEGFGIPVLEAMAVGTPVICSFASSLPEVTSETAILVNPNSAKDIFQAISALESNDALRARLSECAKARAREFSWKKSAEKTLETVKNAGVGG